MLVFDARSRLQIEIALDVLEIIVKVWGALTGYFYAAALLRNVYVVYGIIVKELLFLNIIIYAVKLLCRLLCRVGIGGKGERVVVPISRLEYCRHRARVYHINAEVNASVDARKHEVVAPLKACNTVSDAVRRGGVAGICLNAVHKVNALYLHRLGEIYRVTLAALLTLRGNHGDLAELFCPLGKKPYALGINTVVVGYKYSHSQPSLFAL